MRLVFAGAQGRIGLRLLQAAGVEPAALDLEAAVLDAPATAGRVVERVGGDDPVAEAAAAVVAAHQKAG